MVSWGLAWTNAKIVGSYVDALIIMPWRFGIASIFFTFVVYLSQNPFKITSRAFIFIFINSIFMVSYSFFFFKGTQIGLAGKGGVFVTTLNPLLTSLITGFFFNTKFKRSDFWGLALGFLGGLIIIEFWNISFNQLKNSGNLYFICAALSWTFVTIVTNKSKSEVPFITYSFWSFTISLLFSIFIARNSDLKQVLEFDFRFWINMFFLSIGAMGFGTTIYFLASIQLGAKRASSFIFTVPITAMGFSMLFLNESLTLNILIGGALGIVAVYLINKK